MFLHCALCINMSLIVFSRCKYLTDEVLLLLQLIFLLSSVINDSFTQSMKRPLRSKLEVFEIQLISIMGVNSLLLWLIVSQTYWTGSSVPIYICQCQDYFVRASSLTRGFLYFVIKYVTYNTEYRVLKGEQLFNTSPIVYSLKNF